jgi:O-antigen/teichoic acid export membrane protein
MIKKILKSEFNRNVLTLLTGTTLAQAILFLIAPILTRIFLPEDYGILAAFIAVFTVFSTFITLKYDQVIILPKSDKEAFNLLKAMKVKKGDEVIIPGYTCVVIPNAIKYLRARPG